MNSILTNSAALSALQSLNMTQQELQITQNQVSTGLAVQTAADNAAYWSIGQQLTSDSNIVQAANTAMQQSQAMLDTANSAIQSVITTIDSIQTAITEATNPGANITAINSTLSTLSSQLVTTIEGGTFNGVNLLNGSQANTLTLVSGYDATASGGVVSTIGMTPTALIDGTPAITAAVTAGAATTVTDPTLVSQLESATNGTNTTWSTATPGVGVAGGGATTIAVAANVLTVVTTALDGVATTSTYTAYSDTAGGTAATNTSAFSANNLGGAAVWTVSSSSTAGTVATATGSLIENGTTILGGTYDLTALGGATGATKSTLVTALNAKDMLSAVSQALSAVTTYASTIGATQDALTAATTFNSALGTDYANGISALVDADMNTASTRLQALQTQEQLGIQSLSIANHNTQLILKLFNG